MLVCIPDKYLEPYLIILIIFLDSFLEQSSSLVLPLTLYISGKFMVFHSQNALAHLK